MVAAARPGHPLTEGALTPVRLAAAQHVAVSRRGRFTRPLDIALAEQNLQRQVSVVLASHLAAMTLAARSDMVCLVLPPRPSLTTPGPSDCTSWTSPGTATADHRYGLAPPTHGRWCSAVAPQGRPPSSLRAV